MIYFYLSACRMERHQRIAFQDHPLLKVRDADHQGRERVRLCVKENNIYHIRQSVHSAVRFKGYLKNVLLSWKYTLFSSTLSIFHPKSCLDIAGTIVRKVKLIMLSE